MKQLIVKKVWVFRQLTAAGRPGCFLAIQK